MQLPKSRQSLVSDRSGAAVVMWALVLPVIIGGVGLGVDVGSWYMSEHNLQNATDAAALAAGYDITGGSPSQTVMSATAYREMTRNGFSSDDVTLTVHYPPTSGEYSGNTQAVEVIASRPQSRFFSKLFLDSDPAIIGRSVATRQPTGSACVLALETVAVSALLLQGSADISLQNCSAAANSTSSEAINLKGSSSLEAYSLYTAGGYAQSGASSLSTTETPVTYAPPLQDPYENLEVPSYAGCTQTNLSVNGSATLNPGVYCNGMDFGAQAVVTLNPGTYIVDRGTFNANGQARITGTGVTIILTSSTGSDYSTVTINGGANVSLSAATSGDYAGVLFYQDRNAPVATNTNKFNGGGTTNFEGALYFPKQELEFSGNNESTGSGCTKLISKTVTFTGNSYLSNNCPASVATVATSGNVKVVE